MQGRLRDSPGERPDWLTQATAGRLTAQQLLSGYCRMLYERLGSFEAVARSAGLGRTTAQNYVRQDMGSGIQEKD